VQNDLVLHAWILEGSKEGWLPNDERMSLQASITNFEGSFFFPQHQTHVCMIKFGWCQQLLK
jgi:hypothetical protein